MVKTWVDIDPIEAEACLRGLTRRLSDLDRALEEQQSILKQMPDSFAFALGCRSLLKMQENLQKELSELSKHRVAEKIDLALYGESFQEHTASIFQLGHFLVKFQNLFSSIGQALRTGPTLRGKIPSEILNLTELKVAAVYPSSFGMSLVSPTNYDLMGKSLSVAALSTMFQLLTSLENEDSLIQFSGELGIRTFSHLKQVFIILNDHHSGVKLKWSDYTGTQYSWDADKNKVSIIVEKLKNIKEEQSSEIQVTGKLVGASILRNRFEILIENTNELIEGKALGKVSEALADVFGKACDATLIENSIIDKATGNTRKIYSLINIQEIS